MVEELKTLGKKWFSFSVLLGVPKDELDKIEADYPKDIERCKIEIFNYWLSNELVPTWDHVAHALENAGRKVLAADIVKKYLCSATCYYYY